jgi:acyl-CoA reductase-like NAD-dependent aldehyde dehydrogenase
MIDPESREAFQAPYRAPPQGLLLVAGSPQPLANPAAADPLLLAVEDPAARAAPLYAQEHFGPALIVDAYDDPDECVPRLAANPYRLACSVFTADRARFRACAARLPYGQVNWNRPTAGARSDLPFGGCGLSGNGRPAAVAACEIFADETVVWE